MYCMNLQLTIRYSLTRRLMIALITTAVTSFLGVTAATAQTSVMVEGNCNNPQATSTLPGTCGDYDGDGRLGRAEDSDGDQVFGTLNPAIWAVVGQSGGTVTVVTSGVFYANISINSPLARGTIVLQAAPGVDASLELPTFPPEIITTEGILIHSTVNRSVVLRNLTIRNCTPGIGILGNARVTIDNCRLDGNYDRSILVNDEARVTITETKILASNTGDPDFITSELVGAGIEFNDNSSGSIFLTTISGTRGFGVANRTNNRSAVCAYLVNVFDNTRNYLNVTPSSEPCGSRTVKGRTFFDR